MNNTVLPIYRIKIKLKIPQIYRIVIINTTILTILLMNDIDKHRDSTNLQNYDKNNDSTNSDKCKI